VNCPPLVLPSPPSPSPHRSVSVPWARINSLARGGKKETESSHIPDVRDDLGERLWREDVECPGRYKDPLLPREGSQGFDRLRVLLLTSGGGEHPRRFTHPPSPSLFLEEQRRDATVLGLSSSQTETEEEEEKERKQWTLVWLSAAAILISYADRSNIANAIVPMAKDMQWDKATEGVVLSAFFAGYAVTQMVGGFLADRNGGRNLLTFGLASWSLFTALTPVCADIGLVPLLFCRVGLGLGEGGLPCYPLSDLRLRQI